MSESLSHRTTRCRLRWGLLACLFAGLLVLTQQPRPVEAQEPASGVPVSFGLTNVWSIHLEIPGAEFGAMQPAPGGGFGQPPPPPRRDANGRPTEKNLFGTEFPWVQANVTVNGTTVRKAGVRYSGDITYFVSNTSLKRPLRVGFDRFGGEKLGTLSGIQLQAMPMDPAMARQVLAAEVFRVARVPTPKTAFAEVTLTVPGTHDRAYLGLFTVVEEVDRAFLADRLGSDKGLLMRPFGAKGLDYLGENWESYKGVYRPQREATREESKRLIDFTKLIQRSEEAVFQKQIGEFLDVDAFLRFLAANALTSNLESFFALGHNFHLYLDPKTGRFHFLPGDLEFALANFLLMGGPEQVMNLSLTKPYPGENKLPERLLAIKEVKEKYLALVRELSQSTFTQGQFLKNAEAVEKATRAIRERETKVAGARREAPGFAGPAGPQPPDLKTFADRRAASVATQLAGKSTGFAPQPLALGPPPGGGGNRAGPTQPMDQRTFAAEVRAPSEFQVTLFATPPLVNSPVAIACEPSGALYVAVDEQGSLGRTPGGGKIVRLVDKDGDGKADTSTVFARVDHPRGVVTRDGKVWVCHPPLLSVFRDSNHDGVSDSQEVLVTGLTTDQITNRGGDHTTNCVRLGIDGWLYIGVGDYGIKQAKGKDGRTISLRGGGVVRVRPDGTELEIYCNGLRNPFDLGIDPFLNLFTRDNTNDGAGWDTRISLLQQTALYGYTQLFANFTDEIMPTLGTFGNGGGTGAVIVSDPRWPEQFRSSLLTGDWGRSEVYRHELKPHGPTFDLKQEVFLTLPRATGMDLDADGRLYVASWRGGEASVYVGPNVGFVARVVPRGFTATAFPHLKELSDTQLVEQLFAPQAVTRLHAQGEILARGRKASLSEALAQKAADTQGHVEGRIATIFTLKQLDGQEAHPVLLKLAESPSPVREFALRALTDRAMERANLDARPFVTALADPSPRVRAQAAICLGRLGDGSAARHLLPHTIRPQGSLMPTQRPIQNQPDPDRVVPHLAVRALVALNAIETCLEALDGPYASGALWALRSMHDPKAVDGLIRKLGTVRSPELRRGILGTLIRLYHREADYTGSWWGIRPDSTGPYYDRVLWAMSPRIGAVVTAAVLDADKDTAAFLKAELARHKVTLPGVTQSAETLALQEKPLVLPKADPKNPNQIANMPYEVVAKRTLATKGDGIRGESLFRAQSCVACHTTADGQTPKGPHLVEIGKRLKPEELIESVLKPSAKLAQGYETYHFSLTNGRVLQGFVVSERADATVVRQTDGVQVELKKTAIESRTMHKLSAMPEGLVANLTPEQLADLIAYLQSIK